MLGHGGDEVPGDQHVVRRQGAHGVRGHGGVAQPHYQGGALRREHGLQLGPHRADGPLKKVRLPLPEAGEVNGEVTALGFPQGLLSPPVQNLHPGHRIALLPGFCGLDAGEPGGFLCGFLPELPGLQGQVGALCKHRAASQTERFPALGFAESGGICGRGLEKIQGSFTVKGRSTMERPRLMAYCMVYRVPPGVPSKAAMSREAWSTM